MIGLFVDVPNVYYNAKKKYNGRVNYEKLHNFVATLGPINRSFAYGFHLDGEASPFIFFMKKIGFECKWQKLVKYKVEDQEKFRPHDLGVSIAMDVVRNAKHFGTLVLVSSNPNLEPLIQWSLDQGIKVILVGVRVPSQLKEKVTQWIEIKEDLIDCVKPE